MDLPYPSCTGRSRGHQRKQRSRFQRRLPVKDDEDINRRTCVDHDDGDRLRTSPMLSPTTHRADPIKILSMRHLPPVNGHQLIETGELMGASMSFRRNAEIYGEGEPADYLYKIVSGTARTYKVLSDGRRQIGGFYLPGDIMGLETAEEHSFSAEAISGCKALLIKRRT